MPFLDWELIEDQLDEIDHLTIAQKNLTRTLLRAVDKNDAIIVKDGQVLEVVQKLARGHIAVDDSNDDWTDLQPGEYAVRDVVRVKLDAYDGENASRHNGKRGRIVSIRAGVPNVLYDGQSAESATGHDYTKLEKLV